MKTLEFLIVVTMASFIMGMVSLLFDLEKLGMLSIMAIVACSGLATIIVGLIMLGIL